VAAAKRDFVKPPSAPCTPIFPAQKAWRGALESSSYPIVVPDPVAHRVKVGAYVINEFISIMQKDLNKTTALRESTAG
jgi:hypothetical protein